MRAEEELATKLFGQLATETSDPPGITRATFGSGEAFAHKLTADAAWEMGLDVTHDVAGNQYMTWHGRDRAKPGIIVGSHMDSVRHGGNFDGAAGVIAGLSAVRALKDAGFEPTRDVKVMAIRAEELVWFPTPYCGSRMAFGLLNSADYEKVKRSDTGRSLAEHMRDEGFDPDALMSGARPLDPKTIAYFLEVHIEQGPTLEERGIPVGIVTGIRGNLRYRHCRILGTYSHAGAVPREYRRDAVMAGTEFVQVLERLWNEHDAAGRDFVATVGEFWTDGEMHGMTKVPGDVRFTMDLRSLDNRILVDTDHRLREEASRISSARDVSINIGEFTNAPPAIIDPFLIDTFEKSAGDVGVPVLKMPSGAGHDCATFSWQGIDCGMLFIRNQNGSHNPDEDMQFEDFDAAVRVLAAAIRRLA